ncbi:hypothetical protein CLTEP_18260 [Clostridium tepidiprofundi DSM 19306]|uniref:Uncharacterized protein n=1 Tax=Clostridium tepidiprofundi DSM 19306 TaxID=1121338 RepID=A0A151B2W4_9CLOT|nr:hypothetical protein [Clostridium tepidiprofundi]KYH34251.1 hypothetical protein CLTEP_18260 [Clostridium tepidiprofundi DSM 19306]
MTQENYGVQRAWANAKEYFILNDILRDKPKIFVYKNNKLLYSIDNDINNDGLYENIFFNSSGDKFVCQKLDKSKKQWQLDIFNAEDGVKEETYFKQKNEHFVLLQWTEKGMIFGKYDGWEERSKLIPKLFMLNQQKEFQEIWDYSHTPYEVCDINGEWALLKR